MQIFQGILFFKATNNTETNKSLSCYRLGSSTRLCAVAAAELFVCVCVVCVCVVCGFEGEDSLEHLHSVLFCLIKKYSVETFVCFPPVAQPSYDSDYDTSTHNNCNMGNTLHP